MHRLQRRSKDAGFTLVELLVVIIIIGILAAIAIPAFLNQRGKAKTASEQEDLRSVAGKMEIYNTEKSTYVGVAFGSGTGAGHTIAGGSQTVGSDKVTLSPNNTVKLESVGLNGFCLSVTNPGVSSPAKLYYDSSGGGITETSCASKTYP